MKIGLARRGYSATGGAETYLRRFAQAATAAGHESVLFATRDWPADAWPGEIIRVPSGSPRAFADHLRALRPREHCDFLLSMERVWECDAYRAGDGVHAAWLKRRAQFEPFWKPFVRSFSSKHAGLLELEAHLFSPSGAGMVIANSKMVKTEIQEHFAYPAEKIHVVYNGVPPLTASTAAVPAIPPASVGPPLPSGPPSPPEPAPPEPRREIRRELGLGEHDYVLLFVGSGWERKGLRFAIEAINAEKSHCATLLVAGRGSSRSMPRSSRVRYLGPRSDIFRLLAAADAFLLPTLYEPFSNACLEALAAGLPVITTRSNGFSEIITQGLQGEIIEDPSDTAILALAIEDWSAPEKRQGVRPELIALGTRFSIEKNVQLTLALIADGV